MSQPASSIRLTQSLNYTMDSREVGVMNVWEDQPGAVVAQLSVYDPVSGTDDDIRVRVGDEIAVGSKRYRVVEMVTAKENERAWLSIVSIAKAVG
jgi:hypothetical protein